MLLYKDDTQHTYEKINKYDELLFVNILFFCKQTSNFLVKRNQIGKWNFYQLDFIS